MEKKIITFIFLVLLFLSLVKNIFAEAVSDINIDKTNVSLLESFQITTKIIEGQLNSAYFIKCRIGADSSHLNEGQTFNSSTSEWLNDNGSWNKMPQITLDNTGLWKGTITCRVKDSATIGDKVVYVRACLNNSGNCDNFFQSTDSVLINVTALTTSDTPSPPQTSSPTLSETISPPTLTLTPQTYNNMYISEAMIDPETDNNEWVEIYNANDFEVTLSNWYIDDLENSGSTPKQFSLTIPAKSYISYDLSSSVFNNTGDSVRILDSTQKEIDSFQYEASDKGKTFARTSFENDNFCLQTPTKNNSNSSCLNPTSSSAPKSTSTLGPTNTLIKTPSITVTISKSRSTITPTKFFLFAQNQPVISDSPEETDGEVLGITAENQSNNNLNRPLLTSLTFASFSYSALSIISIFIKLKLNS